MAGGLSKLMILPFRDSETLQVPLPFVGPSQAPVPAGPPFVAQFNPETFSVNTEIELGEEKGKGEIGSEAKYIGIKPRTFSFDLLLDGTGVVPKSILGTVVRDLGGEAVGQTVGAMGLNGDGAEQVAKDVIESVEMQIINFKLTVGFQGFAHRPNFLLIQWGTFIIIAAIESYSINYKLFRPDGTPLRTVISASFKEHLPRKLRHFMMNLNSPDLTHLRSVGSKEHLSLMSYDIYKSSQYYFHVGEANELNNLRQLKKGTALTFPPLDK